MNGPKRLTVREVAERLDISPVTVRRLINRGEIPATNVSAGHTVRGRRWRITEAALAAFDRERAA